MNKIFLLAGCLFSLCLFAKTPCDPEQIIKQFDLTPLPKEGGYFRQTYKSSGMIPQSAMPGYKGNRPYSTAIYYLVTKNSFSELHKVKSEEVFHFYLGDTMEMVQIDPAGKLHKIQLGTDYKNGEVLQVVVPSNTWQGTRLADGGSCALIGCTVAPGFEYEDLEMKTRKELSSLFPHFKEIIKKFTHE